VIEIIDYATAIVMATVALLVALQSFTKLNPLNKVRDWLNQPIKEDLSIIHKKLSELEDKQLKLMVCSSDLPLSERVVAGRIYVKDRHLNGDVKARYEVLEEEYKEELRKRC
jgi:hypothetical protein